jgi:hypothetical protein
MICSRYADDPQEIELEADQTGLAALSTLLTEGWGSIKTTVPPVPAAPYDGYVDSIEVEKAEGLVSIARQGKLLRIRGSGDLLSVLARNLASLIGGGQDGLPATVPYHLHIEHYPEHPYLDSGSAPLILVRLEGDS